jgi:uncharacterized protein (UPF0332 family)
VTEDQATLIAKARDSVRGAELLARDGLYDFAVSRAYYTMLYCAEAMLLGEELRFSSHGAVISSFGQHFAKTDLVPRKFHHYLIDAQDSRVQGDYDIHSSQTTDDAALAINRAYEFIALAEGFLTQGEPPAVHDRPATKPRRRKAASPDGR